jgi:hypothetical protein
MRTRRRWFVAAPGFHDQSSPGSVAASAQLWSKYTSFGINRESVIKSSWRMTMAGHMKTVRQLLVHWDFHRIVPTLGDPPHGLVLQKTSPNSPPAIKPRHHDAVALVLRRSVNRVLMGLVILILILRSELRLVLEVLMFNDNQMNLALSLSRDVTY